MRTWRATMWIRSAAANNTSGAIIMADSILGPELEPCCGTLQSNRPALREQEQKRTAQATGAQSAPDERSPPPLRNFAGTDGTTTRTHKDEHGRTETETYGGADPFVRQRDGPREASGHRSALHTVRQSAVRFVDPKEASTPSHLNSPERAARPPKGESW
jgi:hypothetical protein